MDDQIPPFVRTDFSDAARWASLLDQATQQGEMGFQAYLRPVDDRRFENAPEAAIRAAFPDETVIFAVDAAALATGGILCIDGAGDLPAFRARPGDLWLVENNLSTGNLLFEELSDQVDETGFLVVDMGMGQ